MSVFWDNVRVINNPNEKEIIVSFNGSGGYGAFGSNNPTNAENPGGLPTDPGNLKPVTPEEEQDGTTDSLVENDEILPVDGDGNSQTLEEGFPECNIAYDCLITYAPLEEDFPTALFQDPDRLSGPGSTADTGMLFTNSHSSGNQMSLSGGDSQIALFVPDADNVYHKAGSPEVGARSYSYFMTAQPDAACGFQRGIDANSTLIQSMMLPANIFNEHPNGFAVINNPNDYASFASSVGSFSYQRAYSVYIGSPTSDGRLPRDASFAANSSSAPIRLNPSFSITQLRDSQFYSRLDTSMTMAGGDISIWSDRIVLRKANNFGGADSIEITRPDLFEGEAVEGWYTCFLEISSAWFYVPLSDPSAEGHIFGNFDNGIRQETQVLASWYKNGTPIYTKVACQSTSGFSYLDSNSNLVNVTPHTLTTALTPPVTAGSVNNTSWTQNSDVFVSSFGGQLPYIFAVGNNLRVPILAFTDHSRGPANTSFFKSKSYAAMLSRSPSYKTPSYCARL